MSPHMVCFYRGSIYESNHMVKPFPLDYHQTLLSLLDILSEVYQKIARILGPSPFQLNPMSSSAPSVSGSVSSNAHMMGPLGLLSPHPGVSYLFSGIDAAPESGDASLWGIVGGNNYGGAFGNPPPPWTGGMGETFLKIDSKFKVDHLDRISLPGLMMFVNCRRSCRPS